MINGQGKSDFSILPAKLSNNPRETGAETMEEREETKGNTSQQNVSRTQRRNHDAPNALERVRQFVQKNKKQRCTALFHHLTLERLRASFYGLKKRAAAGVDGVTWADYYDDLENNLKALHNRLHRGAYRAKPTRKVCIPKANGEPRLLGIVSIEDKIVQSALTEILSIIYEEEFVGFSYGFRPGRGQHDALDALGVGLKRKVDWVYDVDIRGFFDAISHEWLIRFVEHRIGDKRVVNLIRKWLNAGALDTVRSQEAGRGSPQGAIISPLLANIYMHYAFDLWVSHWRRTQAQHEMIIVRYADDIIIGFQRYGDVRRFRTALKERLGKFGLEVHPTKARLLRFGRFAAAERRSKTKQQPETFNFLGFTHICSITKHGRFKVSRFTDKARMRATLRAIRERLRRDRHLPISTQGRWLQSVLRGYFQYFAVPSNITRLSGFRTQVIRSWLFALRRRSQRHRMTWAKMNRLARYWLPPARVLHPWPEQRFNATTRGRSPVR